MVEKKKAGRPKAKLQTKQVRLSYRCIEALQRLANLKNCDSIPDLGEEWIIDAADKEYARELKILANKMRITPKSRA